MDDVDVCLKARLLEMNIDGIQEDSTHAAEILNKMAAACIITLGGDGTNRVVAKACNKTPLLPISTGTNNVFPFMIEGTLAGMAAGILAGDGLSTEQVCREAPRLEILRGDELVDIALIDVVVTDEIFVGTRAVWEIDSIKEVFLTRARPSNIGFSALGGNISPMDQHATNGLHITIGPGKQKVKTPIAPGLIDWLPIASHRKIEPGEKIAISHVPAVVALDGERELAMSDRERLHIRLNPHGPLVVDMDTVLLTAAKKGLFLHDQT
jgi:predicted polyphosphate/ATP-dependent NAD kinase